MPAEMESETTDPDRMRTALATPFVLAGGLAVLGAALLWLQFGERVFVDRLIAGIAGCF